MTKFHNVSTTASYRWSTAAYQTSQHRLFCLRRSGNRLGHLGFCWGSIRHTPWISFKLYFGTYFGLPQDYVPPKKFVSDTALPGLINSILSLFYTCTNLPLLVQIFQTWEGNTFQCSHRHLICPWKTTVLHNISIVFKNGSYVEGT